MGREGMLILIRSVIENIAKAKGKSFEQVERAVQDNFVKLTESLPALRAQVADMISNRKND